MAEFTEKDIQDFDGIESREGAVLLKEVKALRAEVADLRDTIFKKKTKIQRKAEIMKIKDTNERLQAIRDNIELFK